MWILKLVVDSRTQFLGRMALKHHVSITGYILTHYKDKNWIYSTACGFMFGNEKNKNDLIKDIKKQKEFVNLDFKNDFAIIVTKQPLIAEPMYDSRILWIEPTIINYKEGKNVWNMASFDRIVLQKVYTFAKKHFNAEIIKFKQEKISNISIISILPELTKKQKQALEIAISKGYYDYPKKSKLEYLAKLMNVSYSTYQAHLKKAEGKIMPSIYRKL